MKTSKSKFVGGLLAVSMSVVNFSAAMANDENYLNSDPIDINGNVYQEQNVSDAELENVKSELRKQKTTIVINKEKKKKYKELSNSTEKLADVTEEMIEERKESQVSIDKYNKKIDCLMAQGFKEGCEEFVKKPKEDIISTKQAAPKIQATPIVAKESFGSKIKILPYTGSTTFMTDSDQLEAGLVAGIKLETLVDKRFSVGMGFNYASLKAQDFGGSNYMNSNYFNYYDSYYSGREIEYKNLNFNIYSKFFMIKNDKLKPYIGAGLGYNRTNLAYTNNNSASPNYGGSYYGYSFGDEEVVTSHMNLELMIGSEIKFSKTVGANLELNYTRALGSNISSENGLSTYLAPDQQRLEDLSGELGEASIVSLFAGVLVEF